jgi:PKD repeat protein
VEGNQANAALAMDSAGRWAGAWEDPGADGDGQGVLCRRFDASGLSLLDQKLFAGDTGVGEPAFSVEGHSLDSDDSGVVTAVWQSREDPNDPNSPTDIFLARLSRSGARLPVTTGGATELRVNASSGGNQLAPQVAVEPGTGRGVAAWVHQATPGTDGEVRYRQFTLGGGGEVQLGTEQSISGSVVLATALQSTWNAVLDVAVNHASNWNSDGRLLIVWEGKEAATTETDIFGALFRGDGSAVGSVFTVNTTTAGSQVNPSAAMDAAGGSVVVWQAAIQDAVHGRAFDANGTAAGAQFALNSTGFEAMFNASVSLGSSGQGLAAWIGHSSGGTVRALYGRRLESSGTFEGNDFRLSASTADSLAAPEVTIAEDGGFVAAWQNSTQSFQPKLRRFTASNSPVDGADVTLLAKPTLYPAITLTAEGDIVGLLGTRLSTAEGGTSTAMENQDLVLTRLTPEPPSAAFSSMGPVCSASPTSFTDQSSTEVFTSVTGWKWDLQYNGASFDANAIVQNPSTTYPNVADTIEVLLRVTDNRLTGRTGFALGSVTTQQLPARPAASFTSTVNADRTVDFAGCASCGGYGAPFRYDWAFGDGGQLLDTTNRTPTHGYSQSGAYAVTLAVRDQNGCQSSAPFSSNVQVLPILSTVTATIEAGQPVAGVGDDIEVELVGDPNRVGKADIARVGGGFTAAVDLSETPPGSGVYRGAYTVLAGTGSFEVATTGKLSETGGVREVTKQAAGTLLLDTLSPNSPSIEKSVGLGTGANYTTANPEVTLPGTVPGDAVQLLLSGLRSPQLSYTPGQTSWSASGTLDPGPNLVSIKARDLAENESSADSITITLEQLAPVTVHDRFAGGTVRNADTDPTAEVFFPLGVLRQPTPYVPANVNMTRSLTPPGIPIAPGLDVQKIGPFGWDLAPSESFNGLATVTLRYSDIDIAGLNEDRLTLVYRDTAGKQWSQSGVFIESLDKVQNRIVMKTLHFTFFAFAEGAQPTPPTPTPTPGPVPAPPNGPPSSFAWVVLVLGIGGVALRRMHS